MPASLTATDAAGAFTVEVPGAALSRFNGWTPAPAGPLTEAETLTGDVHAFVFAERDDVAFSLPLLPADALGSVYRLLAVLRTGGTCTVNTGDLAARSYLCQRAPGTTPRVELTDRTRLTYTLFLELRGVDPGVPLLCIYR